MNKSDRNDSDQNLAFPSHQNCKKGIGEYHETEQGELEKHELRYKATGGVNACKVCKKTFKTSSSLINHMVIHKKVKNFMCRFCAKQVSRAGELKIHERMHTKEKVFVCQECGKGFSHRQSLITHNTVHTGIKPFQCENCNRFFSCIGNLSKHRKHHPDTCGHMPLKTHKVNHPVTKVRIKLSAPANTRINQNALNLDVFKSNTKSNKSNKHKIMVDTSAVNESIRFDTNKSHLNLSDKELNEPSCDLLCEKNCEDLDYRENSKGKDILPTKFEKCFGSLDIFPDYLPIEINNAEISELFFKDNTINTDGNLVINKVSEIPLDPKYEEPKDIGDNIDENMHEIEKINEGSSNVLDERIPSKEFEKFVKDRDLVGVNVAKCISCNKEYSNLKWLFKHEKKHLRMKIKPTKLFKCTCCSMKYATRSERQIHQENHHAEILTCNDCEKIFSSSEALNLHKNSVHKGIPRKSYSFICEACGAQFKQKCFLSYHERNKCENKSFDCKICGKHLSNPYSRQNHMRLHNSVKEFVCKFCDKSFYWKGQLKIHERKHTGEKPFTCLYCPRAFAYRESLITHSSVHTGIKHCICKGCGREFSSAGNLTKHKKTHATTCGVA